MSSYTVNAFGTEDVRPKLAVDGLGLNGSLAGMTILELGPLEGGHSYQLEKYGAETVTAIEANSEAFLKCLIVKNALNLKTSFLFGDAVGFLRDNANGTRTTFDLVFCSGILYQMADPLTFISLIGGVTDRCFVWTHYFREGLPGRRPVEHTHDGFTATYWVAEYGASMEGGGFWGGNQNQAAWLSREDILAAFRHGGFDEIAVVLEDLTTPIGPHFAFTARRTGIGAALQGT